MKKALEIWVDDDATLAEYCATFVCWNEQRHSSVTMQNTNAKGKDILYLPWKIKTGEAPKLFTRAEFYDWQDACKKIMESGEG